ncbi:MAG: hypothetical protein EHM50_02945 [Lysobacterales bacterium]|nr:MAG: hypothetical protein EHM50_02945 [Xanthomonadales bacterium]
MATTAAAVPRATAPRRLYVGIAVLAIAIAAVGFWPTYFSPLLAGGVDKPAIIHFHAAVFVGWLAIFLTQVALAATGRLALHMKLGRFAVGYGVLVIFAGLLAGIGMFVLRVRAGDVAAAQTAVLGPLLDMLFFAPLFAAAVYYRRKPELHKRLMVVATTSLLVAAAVRMPFLGQPRNMLLLHSIWTAPILLAMAHDFLRQRRVHPVYALGLVLLLIQGPAVRVYIRASDEWRSLSGWLASLVA